MIIDIEIIREDLKKPANRAMAFVNGAVVAEIETKVNSPAICGLCRILVQQGYPEDTSVVIRRGDNILFKPSTVGYWASKTITEGDQEIRMKPFVERDFGEKEGA